MKIASYASKSTAGYHHHFNSWPPRDLIWSTGAPPAPLSINRPPLYYHHFNSWPPPDLIWSNGAPPALLPTTGPIQTNIFKSWPPREDLASTHPYHRPIQAKFGPFSAGITPRRQHHMEVFGGFHIGGYFHLFSFMGWILNFISIHPINGMNKWSILIIYSFMK